MVEANECLDDKEGRIKKIVDFKIPRENTQSKGVITEWDLEAPLGDLAETIEDQKGILRIERMRKKFYDKEKKKMEESVAATIK